MDDTFGTDSDEDSFVFVTDAMLDGSPDTTGDEVEVGEIGYWLTPRAVPKEGVVVFPAVIARKKRKNKKGKCSCDMLDVLCYSDIDVLQGDGGGVRESGEVHLGGAVEGCSNGIREENLHDKHSDTEEEGTEPENSEMNHELVLELDDDDVYDDDTLLESDKMDCYDIVLTQSNTKWRTKSRPKREKSTRPPKPLKLRTEKTMSHWTMKYRYFFSRRIVVPTRTLYCQSRWQDARLDPVMRRIEKKPTSRSPRTGARVRFIDPAFRTRPYRNFVIHSLDAKCSVSNSEAKKKLFHIQFREITPNDYDTLLELDESVRPVSRPMVDIRRLPSVQIGVTITTDPALLCVICLSTFRHGENAILLKCSHMFHHVCIASWLWTYSNNSCPVDGLMIIPEA